MATVSASSFTRGGCTYYLSVTVNEQSRVSENVVRFSYSVTESCSTYSSYDSNAHLFDVWINGTWAFNGRGTIKTAGNNSSLSRTATGTFDFTVGTGWSGTVSITRINFGIAISASPGYTTMTETYPNTAVSFSQWYSAPSGLSASVSSISQTSANIAVSLSSYGNPSSTSGRYIEGAILNQNSYGASYRYATASNTTSSTVTVSNSSSGTSGFTITANTRYYYGAYASNTVLNTNTVSGTFVTLPNTPSGVSITGTTSSSLTIRGTTNYGGNYYSTTIQYSTNNGSSWSTLTTTSSNSFSGTISGLSAYTSYTVLLRAHTTAGNSGTVSVSGRTSAVAPSGLSISLSSKTYNSATFRVTLSSYGAPSSVSGRYIEAEMALGSATSYASTYRRLTQVQNTNSATITVNNSSAIYNAGSSASSGITLTGNTMYKYAAYATNTVSTTSTSFTNIYLPPPTPSGSASPAYTSATLTLTTPADGGAQTKTVYYRYKTSSASSYSSWTSAGTVSGSSASTKTVTLSGLSHTTTYNVQVKSNTSSGGDSATYSFNFTTNTYVAPQGLSVGSPYNITSHGATFNVSVSSYGTPSNLSGRYLEAAIIDNNSSTYSGTYLYHKTNDQATSASIVVSNSAWTGPSTSASNRLSTVKSNTTYKYGGYATNTALGNGTGVSTVAGTFTTKADFSTAPSITFEQPDFSDGYFPITIHWASDSGMVNAEVVTLTVDNTVIGTITRNSASATTTTTTIELPHSTSIGTHTYTLSMSNADETYTGTFTKVAYGNFYGSVDGKSKEVLKLYGSVNGKSKYAHKLYGSVNGVTKRIM